MITALDVIWIYDECIRPPGPKLVVCVEPKCGFFFRINSKPIWQTPILLKFSEYSDFLTHDSYLECGAPLELDDYVVYESVRDKGKIGRLKTSVVPAIVNVVQNEDLLSPADKQAIIQCLKAAKDW